MATKWYAGVNCVKLGCGAFRVFLEDPAGGTRTVEFQGPAKVTMSATVAGRGTRTRPQISRSCPSGDACPPAQTLWDAMTW